MPSREEIKAAVELMQHYVETGEHPEGQAGNLVNAALLLARLYLAEHPADDGEPATADWFVSEYGKRHVEVGEDFMLTTTTGDSVVLHAADGARCASVYQLRIPTRRQVRLLIEALTE